MHFLKNIFFVRPCTGILHTDESFPEALPHFILAKVTGTRGIIRGGWSNKEVVFSPLGCFIITCHAWKIRLNDINNVCFFVLRRGFFRADKRSVAMGPHANNKCFLKPDSQSRAERRKDKRLKL